MIRERKHGIKRRRPRPPLLDRYLYLSLTKETVSMQQLSKIQNKTLVKQFEQSKSVPEKNPRSHYRLSSGRTLAP